MNTLAEIKAAVDAGKTVHWKTAGYRVIKDQIGQYLVGWNIGGHGENYIGLTHQDGVTLNGKPQDFYVERDPFAPPTTCPVCWGRAANSTCRVCHGTGVFIRTGRFRDHSCSGCLDGAKPCREGTGGCSWPRARND